MDLSTLVNLVQLVIWVIVVVAYVAKRVRLGPKSFTDRVLLGLIVVGLMVSTWSLWLQYQRQGAEKEKVLIGWGVHDPFKCGGIVNGGPLLDYRDEYEVVVVCGLIDRTIDRFKSKQISVSQRFAIRKGRQHIDFPVNNRMSKSIQKGIEQIKQRAVKQGTAKGQLIPILLNKWYTVALVPKGLDLSLIERMSDIPRHGGFIWGEHKSP